MVCFATQLKSGRHPVARLLWQARPHASRQPDPDFTSPYGLETYSHNATSKQKLIIKAAQLIGINARGLQVRPDLLLVRLEAYDQALRQINTLRLCHRFDRGDDVQVTKLPKEILLDIETLLIESRRQENETHKSAGRVWKAAFKCFQSQCRPNIHNAYVESAMMQWHEDIWAEIDLCDACEEDEECGPFGGACKECEEAYESALDASAVMKEEGGFHEYHAHDRKIWTSLLSSLRDGSFGGYSGYGDLDREFGAWNKMTHCEEYEGTGAYDDPLDLLRKYFGLHAHLATAR